MLAFTCIKYLPCIVLACKYQLLACIKYSTSFDAIRLAVFNL